MSATAGTGTPHAPAPTARWWMLGVVTTATFMLMLDLTVVNVALPELRVALDAGFTDLQWVLDAYALTLAVFLLTGGSLADRLGRKRVFMAGFALFTAASLACGLAWDMLSLTISRGAQGVGAAVLFAVGPALLGHEFRGRERGAAFGVFGAGTGLAIAAGPLIGGALTDGIGWRWIFLVNVPVGLAAMLLGLRFIRESADRAAPGTDWAGLVTFSAAITLLVLGFLRGEAEGWASTPILAMFTASAALLVVFVLIERTLGERAMLDLSVFRVVTFNGIATVALLSNAAGMAAIFLEVSYVQNVLGHTPWETGLRFLPLTLLLFAAAAVSGSMVTRVPPRLTVGVACAFMTAGLLLVTRVGPDSTWTALLPSMLCTGLGMGMFNPARVSLSIAVVEPRKAGMASGVNETFQQVGVATGIAAIGALFQGRVADLFAASDAGRALGGQADGLGEAVAAGSVSEVAAAVPAPLADQVALAARTAFADGLGDVILVAAALSVLSTVIGFLLIRRADLHASALDGTGHPAPAEDAPRTPEADTAAVRA